MKVMGGVGVAIVAVLAGCVSSDAVTCSDGTTCPGGTTCVALTAPAETICAQPAQLAACNGIEEGSACSTGWCHDGACLPIQCGNGRLDLGEVCDDGNTTAGDGCAADCASDETCGNGHVDPLVLVNGVPQPNEQCDDGNLASGDGCSSRCLIEAPTWEQLDATAIPSLANAGAAYDPARDRIVLFGGEHLDNMTGESTPDATVYDWNGSTWRAMPALGGPSQRQNPGMAYDGVSHRVLMFGGNAGDDRAPLGDTWEWDGGGWTRLQPAMSPSPRTEFGIAYDSARKKIVLFGGYGTPPAGGFAQQLGDTWEFDGTTWTQIQTATQPDPRYQHKLVYDPVHGRIVMTGGTWEMPTGMTTTHVLPRDTWAYDGHDWTLLDNTTTPHDFDSFFMLAYDPSSAQIVGYGGLPDGTGTSNPAQTTYLFDGTHWSASADSTPGPLIDAVLVADPKAGHAVLFGGSTTNNVYSSATWLWHAGAWAAPPTANLPGPIYLATVAVDPRHGRAWIFGGTDATSTATNGLWSYDATGWQQHGFATGPSPRQGPGLAYDQHHDQLVLFSGGVDDGSGGTTALPAETWLWNGTTWTKPATTHAPSPRYGATMVFDAVRGKVVLFGGAGDTTNSAPPPAVGDTWEWDGTDWTQTATTGPVARIEGSLAFDPAIGKTVLYGGFIYPTGGDDTWTYDGTWTEVSPSSAIPPRVFPAVGYDPARSSVVMFGGLTLGGDSFSDTWQLDTSATWREATSVTEPASRAGGIAFPDPEGRGVMLFGGATKFDNSTALSELWRLRYQSATQPELCQLSIDNDGDGLAGCADPDCWASCTPLCPPGADCPASAPRCGDGTCDPLETCRNCPADCGGCTAACGDTFCDPPESVTSCPGDCT